MPRFVVTVRRTTGRKVVSTQMPMEHKTPGSAWDMVEWLKCGGDTFVDHEDINSNLVLVDYQVKQLEGVA